jgi:serine/threonine-protein kinase
VVFGSQRAGGVANLYRQAADGTGAVERLTESQHFQFPFSASPDGTQLVFSQGVNTNNRDLMLLPLQGNGRPQPLVQTPFNEINGEISPDGRWLAYESNESGRLEIYVRPLPDVNSGRWQVSTEGGTRPLWARSGRELFYVTPAGDALGRGAAPPRAGAVKACSSSDLRQHGRSIAASERKPERPAHLAHPVVAQLGDAAPHAILRYRRDVV